MYCVLATLGFDTDFMNRRLAREPRPDKVVLLGLKVDEESWRRVEKAFNIISYYCSTLKVQCSLEEISPDTMVREVVGVIERESREGCSDVELFLTGGPRALVIASAIAMLFASTEAELKIVVEGETFDVTLEVPARSLKRILSLSELERRILLEAREPVTPPELARRLQISKATAYRKLRALAEIKLVERADGGEERYIAAEETRRVLSLVSLR